jgi:hypothetical protein
MERNRSGSPSSCCRPSHTASITSSREKSAIGQVLFAQVLPHVFNRIEFWTTGRLKDQANVFWHQQVFGPVPSCSIHLHDEKRVSKGLADMRQEEILHRGIGRGEHKRGHLSLLGCHSRIDVGILAHELTWGSWSDSRRSPSSSGNAHASKAPLIAAAIFRIGRRSSAERVATAASTADAKFF